MTGRDAVQAMVGRLEKTAEASRRSDGTLIPLGEDLAKAAALLTAQQAEIERLREALVDHNNALRSAQQIAFREGQGTNWLSLRGHLTWVLAEHHEISNDARAALAGGSNNGNG